MPLPLIKTTRQWYKLKWCLAAVITGGALMLLALNLLLNTKWGLPLTFSGMALTFGALLATLLVRCPQCRLPWVWWAMRKQPHDQWLIWLISFDKCPNCRLKSDVADGFNS